jgi:acetyl/propionyl-CoA carboxylase alpha subunit
VNAGTVEFLLEANKSFYFLEMNTRLQVEHPVTEVVYGVDLVKAQIKIAEGKELPFTQEELIPRGHAIECRIYAEDPLNGFLPSTGTIEEYTPSEGYGIRNDSGIMIGSEIAYFYDPLLSKLVAWGVDRSEALGRMKRALEEYKISGVSTTIPFCAFVISHPSFIEGDYDIHFVEKYFDPERGVRNEEEELVASLAAASMHNWMNGKDRALRKQSKGSGKWKNKRSDELVWPL